MTHGEADDTDEGNEQARPPRVVPLLKGDR